MIENNDLKLYKNEDVIYIWKLPFHFETFVRTSDGKTWSSYTGNVWASDNGDIISIYDSDQHKYCVTLKRAFNVREFGGSYLPESKNKKIPKDILKQYVVFIFYLILFFVFVFVFCFCFCLFFLLFFN